MSMIIAVVGPTGVGKTKMSIELAKKYNAIVVNCDAMQVYKKLDIGTAKVREEEKENIPHLLFDIKNVDEEYTVYDYQKDLRRIIEENKDKNIIIVGGTGLYLKAALYDYRFQEETTKEDFSNLSNEELYKLVKQKDPNSEIHINNRVRLERFLNKKEKENVPPIKLYDHIIIGLTTDRDKLYERINKRVDIMVEDGLIEEAKYFYDNNIKTKPLMGGIGYKELYEYFDNKISLEEALDKIKQNSRHYAKRQYTFFNNQLNVNWFDVDFNDFENTINKVINFIEEENKND
ncbi:MAG: tRNA (adenosine(37)-N6)-dimethylallyltransferase MiaA [Bacilli bacterium]|nr:tRNA (adenosine(37)-N6)-dimethylallyltransferase MiaA [Bacilli bacterium]